MPETYTPEQIDVLKMAVDYYSKRYGDNKPANGLRAILSALSTAERERGALEVRVAELEAMLQGAAEWQELIKEDVLDVLAHNDIFGDVQDQIACILDRMPLPEPPAIVGKKEGV